MAAAPVYTVRVTQIPGVPFQVNRDEYEYLVEQGILASLDGVTVPADQVVISAIDPALTTPPPVGTVWFNKSAP